jgi:hypothetical protein
VQRLIGVRVELRIMPTNMHAATLGRWQMASVKFSIDSEYSCKNVQYLDEESFEYKYFDKSDFPKVVEKIDFRQLNFIFDLENPKDEDGGYSLVCTKSHRKKATKCSVQLSQKGDEIVFKLIASVDIPLRADPADVKKLKLWLKRLDFAKATPDGFSLEIDNVAKEYIPFTVG